jgi:UDPglucose--hexose-1-phosphate uridylyltransferase
MRDSRLRTFTVFKNVGRAAGQTVGHSISQIVALAVIPSALRRKLESARSYYTLRQRSLFTDILEAERRFASRMVFENDGFIVFCPYASRVPFELAVWPKRPLADFHQITEDEALQLAGALKVALEKLNRALDHPAWHMTLTTAPSRPAATTKWTTIADDFCWHLSILPRLHPPGALETATGCYVNGVWPETVASHLRALEVAP